MLNSKIENIAKNLGDLVENAIKNDAMNELNNQIMLLPKIIELKDLIQKKDYELIVELMSNTNELFYYLPMAIYPHLLLIMLKAGYQNTEIIHRMMKDNWDITVVDEQGNSVTHLTVIYATEELLGVLLDKHKRLDIYNSEKLSPLGLAIKMKRQNKIEIMLAKGDLKPFKEVMKNDLFNYSITVHEFVAARFANVAALKMLLTSGFNKYKRFEYENGFLQQLASCQPSQAISHYEIGQMFNYLYNVLKITSQKEDGWAKLLKIAVNARNWPMMKFIIHLNESFSPSKRMHKKSYVFIFENQDIEAINFLIKIVQEKFNDYFDKTHLFYILGKPYRQDCSILVNYVDINYFKSNKRLAFLAVKNDHSEFIYKLIAKGLDINLYSEKCKNESIASKKITSEICSSLNLSALLENFNNLSYKINPEKALRIDNEMKILEKNLTPSIEKKWEEIYESYKVLSKNTLMHKAVKYKRFRILDILMNQGADPLLVNHEAQTPLMFLKAMYSKESIFLEIADADTLVESPIQPEWIQKLENYTKTYSHPAMTQPLTLRFSNIIYDVDSNTPEEDEEGILVPQTKKIRRQ